MAESLTFPRQRETTERIQEWYASLSEKAWVSWAPLPVIVLLALFINAWGLSENGYGNTYYAAAARSMTESWSNFFFGAFDPGGFITVDKPPVFLWIDALSARIFGYSTWSLLLPSAVAGATSVALLWLMVRRYFGSSAATIAGLVLAFTPIWVSVSRLNLPEPFYILALVAAAYCIIQSIESPRWWAWLAGAGLMVGIAFNTKMLAGWIPGPALALAVVVALKWPWWQAWRQIIARLAILGLVTLAVSASWALVVDNWPASDRPYIGGSTDNTVQDLVLGYNGFGRVEGEDQGFGGGGGMQDRNAADIPAFTPSGMADIPGFTPPADGQDQEFGVADGAGGIFGGSPSLFRMFDSANGGQIAWFLPFALIGSLFSLWRWRLDGPKRAVVVLWLGWLLLFGGVFSSAEGIYHSYYTAAMAPGVAALAGISTVAVRDLARRHRGWAAAGAVLGLVTLWVQIDVSERFPGFFNELRPVTLALVVLGIVLLAVTQLRRSSAMPGLALILAGLFVLPAAWSGYETANASTNTTLPQAGPRSGGLASGSFGSGAFDGGTDQLAAWLQEHSDPAASWDLVVSNAQSASTLIAEHGLSVMALGGFQGTDPAITVAEFADLVQSGEVRYVLTSGGGRGGGFNPGAAGQIPTGQDAMAPPQTQPGGQAGQDSSSQGDAVEADAVGANAVISAVMSACTVVSDPALPSEYQNSLYDCAGHADDFGR